MDNRKLNAYIKKEMKKTKSSLSREKARCKRMYPDYLDNEFNMLDNLFIWGYNTNPKVEPSFLTWDDAYIYYNRATKKYYMSIDTGFYTAIQTEEAARVELDRLSEIEEAFRNFMIQSNLSTHLSKIRFTDTGLEGDSLTELYIKFRYMFEGYKLFRNLKGKF